MNDKRSVNLCSIYMLPLLGLNQFSFGSPGKFVNSYLTEDDEHIVVECTHPFSVIITNHTNYKFGFDMNESHYAVFNVPVFFKDKGDIQKFREGKYSKLSDSAKEAVRKKSGLTYKRPAAKGGYESALELLALDKDKELKKYWEDRLAVRLSDEAELVSIPGEDNFFNLNLSSKLEPTI
jgi:hypothetical protein